MDKVYLVYSQEPYERPFCEKAFSNRTKAKAYIDEKFSWKKQLKEETGLDYDKWYNKEWLLEHKPMPNEMQNWLYDHSIRDEQEYYINTLEVE